MSQRPTPPGRRRAFLLSLVLVLGTLAGVPAAIVATSPRAHAAVAAGDIVFVQTVPGDNPYTIEQRASGGTLTNLSTSTLGSDFEPDVSPDGSRIVFEGERPLTDQPSNQGAALVVMNSDGSGQNIIVQPSASPHVASWLPVWSPDGSQIAYVEDTGTGTYIAVRNADGSGYQRLTTGGVETNPSWSPTKVSGHYRLTYESDTGSLGGQIYVVNDDGTGAHSVTGSDSLTNDMAPVWSPTGNRIYFIGGGGFAYFSSNDNFTTTSVTRMQLSTTGGGLTGDLATHYKFAISTDGSTLTYAVGDSSGCPQVFTMSTSTAATSQLTSTGCSYQNYAPTFVKAAWPPAPPSNSALTFSAPSAHDVPYTRQVTVNLSTSGILRFDLGWSTSSTTAPTSNFQTITDMTTKKGPINFLGTYSSTSGTWNGGTQPDQDWYLWVRSVQTGGTANAWATPLKVHTPRRPVWVGVGDSYSSGHHQDSDEPWCPSPEDTGYISFQTYFNCPAGGTGLTKNDLSYSWVKKAVDSYNSFTHAPTDPSTGWSYGLDLVAMSGDPTSTFGVAGTTPGTSAWASGTAQSAYVRADLYTRYNSWNIVSMTGGANDSSWVDKLADFYKNHFVAASPTPWSVSTASPSTDCPDSGSVYSSLKATQSDGQTQDTHITNNLQGIVTVATNYAPGTRILNVGYPYVVDQSNSCSADSGTWHGSKSVIDDLNADHTAVTGSNVHYLNLTSTAGFGTSPVTSGYLQLRRLYGYPHPVDTGQTQIANYAVTNLKGTW